jgi:hypothetical protein
VYFFRLYGIAPAYALATSLFLFTLNAIIPALIGVYFIYKNRAQFREIKDSLQSTREMISGILGYNRKTGTTGPGAQKKKGLKEE